MRLLQKRLKGFTLVEVLAASLIGSVVAGGTFMALATAARIARQQDGAANAEASFLAQQTVERFRNRIAARPADQLPWPMPNAETNVNDNSWLGTWQDDPPTLTRDPNSITSSPGAERRYCVIKADCNADGDTTDPDDCYRIQVKVCWNGTPCPEVGTGC